MKRIVGLFLFLAVVGCSSEDLSYQYNVNGCDTGKQTFDSKEALCEGLRSSSRNKTCALEERIDRFNKECGGNFTPVN